MSSFRPRQDFPGVSSCSDWNQQAEALLLRLESRPIDNGKSFDREDAKSALHLLEELGPLMRGEKRQGGAAEQLAIDRPNEWEDPVESASEEPLDAYLAWVLLDKIVSSYQDGTMLSSSMLHSVLQLWRVQLTQRDQPKLLEDPLPSPQAVLERFDDWRTHGSIAGLVVDVHCYNILLAAAGSLGQYDLCQQVYDWMWEESVTDSLVQPDRVTLRTMFRAVAQRNTHSRSRVDMIQAAQKCEQLVQDYMARSNSLVDVSTIYQSLVHVWARADPTQARLYLQDMANNHLRHRTNIQLAHKYPPPRTSDWNQVISALSIQHGLPSQGEEVLHDFQVFSSKLRQLIASEFETTAEQSLILRNEHTTRQQDLRLIQIPQPDIFSFNSVMEGWALLGDAEQANRIYDSIRSGKNSMRPNIVTFTSAMKANRADLSRVHTLANDCLRISREQVDSYIVVDAAFFHTWLQACVDAAAHSRDGAVLAAETIVMETMPSAGVSPSKLAFQYLLKCFMIQDDLEGATQWLLKHLSKMDEATILEWTLTLSQKGDIELVSFLDKFTKRTPKTLLQVLIQDGYLVSSNVLEHLLRNLPVDQGMRVLEWLQPEHRTLKCFAILIRSLSASTTFSASVPIDDAKRLEDLWDLAQEQTKNRMSDEMTNAEHSKTVAEIYTSLIVAWSKAQDMERVRAWWDTWTNDSTLMKDAPPTQVAQTAVLSCLAASFQPNQAQQFLNELFTMHQGGQLTEPPDRVMLNLVLKAWLMSANGQKAVKALQMGKEKYGMTPDVISYNTIVQAYVKARQLDHAFQFVRDHVGVVDSFPDMATIRSILVGWSRHRQDYELASRESHKIWKWMLELHTSGVWEIDPRTEPSIKTILADLKQRVDRQRHQAKKVVARA
jgi:pentatricopeptide repeat protein